MDVETKTANRLECTMERYRIEHDDGMYNVQIWIWKEGVWQTLATFPTEKLASDDMVSRMFSAFSL
jgi:hypothetical protein